MWVFTYKIDSQRYLTKCRARLVICGNQQAAGDLPTRATTLASSAFRTLMAIVARFDLKTIQLDAVNAFVHCHLDEVVYMRPPPYYSFHDDYSTHGSRRTPSAVPSVTPNS